MPTIDPTEEFPKVENMLYQLAWKTAQAYPVPFEEARSEAYYAFMRACADFKPDRGSKFSSWCYFWVWTHLKTFVTKRTVDPLVFIEVKESLLGEAPPERSEALEMLEDLSEDAKEIITLLIETPRELIGLAMTPKQLLKKVKEHLVAKGKARDRVDRAAEEIRLRLQAKVSPVLRSVGFESTDSVREAMA